MLSKGDGTLAVGDGPSPDTAGSRLLDGVDSVRATEQARGQVQSLLLEMSNAAQDTGADSLFEHGSVCPRCRQMATPEEVQLWGYCSLCRAQDMSDASSDPSGRYLNKGMAGRGASLMPKDNAGSTPQRLRIANAPKQPPVSAATGDPGPSVSLPAEPPAHAGAVEAAGSGKRSSTYAKAAAERAQAGKAVNGAAGLSAGGVEVGGMGEEGGAGLARLQRVMEQLVSEQRQTNVLLAQVVAELQASAAAAQKPQATRKPRKKAGDAAAPESADDGTAQEPVTAAALAVSEEPAATAAAPAAALSKARAPRQQATAAARAQAPPPPPPAAQSISAPQRGARSAAQAPQSGGTRTRSMAQQTQPNAQRPTAEAARGTAQQPADRQRHRRLQAVLLLAMALERLQVSLGLLLWPIAIGIKFAKTLLNLSIGSSAARHRAPQLPPWLLLQLLSLPFRVLNPPVVLGVRHLEAVASHRAAAAAALGDTGGVPAGEDVSEKAAAGGSDVDKGSGAAAAAQAPVLLAGLDNIPMWTLFAESLGGVKGTTAKCAELMSHGKWQLLYPGGGEDDRTQLKWNASMGFTRMAVKHGAVVVPFASIGLENSLHSIGSLDVAWWLRVLEVSCPDIRLPLLLPLNGMQRQYFAFGEPISTAKYGGDWECNAKCLELYEDVRGSVQHLLSALQRVQTQDPNRYPAMRVARRLLSVAGAIKAYDATIEQADTAI
ncbi:hypothetical protein JKP88DRAFT_292905 [Tribonema minus]|uniref:Uncharacterized protein n=1 Tax=Tribonema minus TaxID=303371 RepID=A0A835ZPL7_9STRA|nr:hypothetical protein JKP88DRAFT_292905 [Tribonema minus]